MVTSMAHDRIVTEKDMWPLMPFPHLKVTLSGSCCNALVVLNLQFAG